MSFDERYKGRYERVIDPAIRDVKVNGVNQEPFRIDVDSRSGDSILTEIIDAISHSQMVLADVSTIGTDGARGIPFRNGNVMYEVGVALAARQPSEVLLVRGDDDPFLFDVSTVPHLKIDFEDEEGAKAKITNALDSRLRDRDYVDDARARMAFRGLTSDEVKQLQEIAAGGLADRPFGRRNTTYGDWIGMAGLRGLVNKQLAEFVGPIVTPDGTTTLGFRLTVIGKAALNLVQRILPP